MANVAVIDDDRKQGDLLKKYLEDNNHSVMYFSDPKRFLGQKAEGAPRGDGRGPEESTRRDGAAGL